MVDTVLNFSAKSTFCIMCSGPVANQGNSGAMNYWDQLEIEKSLFVICYKIR